MRSEKSFTVSANPGKEKDVLQANYERTERSRFHESVVRNAHGSSQAQAVICIKQIFVALFWKPTLLSMVWGIFSPIAFAPTI